LESFIKINVGTAWTPYCDTNSGFSSILISDITTFVLSNVGFNLSIAGLNALQGPHHGADIYNISNIFKDNINFSNKQIKNKKTAIFYVAV